MGLSCVANCGARRPALRHSTPSPQARRHTSAPGRAAGGPRRGFVSQVQYGPRHRCEG